MWDIKAQVSKSKRPPYCDICSMEVLYLGNTAGPLYARYAVRFINRLPKFTAGILSYFKVNLGDMTENMQVYGTQRREPVVVRCCLKASPESSGLGAYIKRGKKL